MKQTSLLVCTLLIAVMNLFAFDFVMEPPNSSIINMSRGFGGINALHVSLLSGPPQDVTLSATGLPAGVTVTFLGDQVPTQTCRFDREGGHQPYGSTFTVKVVTTSATPVGTHTITLAGKSGTLAHSTSFQLQVTTLTASGTMYYVSPSGNDGNPGTASQPFKTIQKGADVAQAGDMVVVKAGTYWERVTINNSGVSGKPITIIGEPGAIIDGNRKITGWEPAPEIASGVYKIPVDQLPFEPAAIAYEGKYALWVWHDNVTYYQNGPGWLRLKIPQGDPMWDAAGAYGYTDNGHGPDAPSNPTRAAYVRLKTGGDPDNEDVTFAGADRPTISIHNKNYITLSGLVIRNGHRPVDIYQGTGITLEHNYLKGGPITFMIANSDRTTLLNNEITLNHYWGEMPSANQNRETNAMLGDLRHMSKDGRGSCLRIEGSSNTEIGQNHIFKSICTLDLNGGFSGDLEIYSNFLHHCNDYVVYNPDNIGDVKMRFHDNLLYELGLEGWRSDGMGNSAEVYIYRNRFYNLTHVCQPEGYHGNSCGDNDFEWAGSRAKEYIYHNSFIGGAAFGMGSYNEEGLPNTWIVNNIFSSDWPYVYFGTEWGKPNWHLDYNWFGGQGDITACSMMWRNGGHNFINSNVQMWDKVNPSFSPSGTARQSGLDLSKSWTLDGVTHPALPGMAGYYTGTRPDLGALQYTTSEINSVIAIPSPSGEFRVLSMGNSASRAMDIQYEIKEVCRPHLTIRDFHGRTVRALDQGEKSEGVHSLQWDGMDSNAKKLANGIYFFQLSAGKNFHYKKIAIMQ